MKPRTQANFVAGFTGLFAVAFGVLTRYLDPKSYPPIEYWVVFSLAYFFFFFSFYIDPLNKLYAWVAERLRGLGELLAGGADENSSQAGSTPTAGRFPLEDSLRVQLLSISVIALTGWLTVHSGGPFISPYGQVLLALPLLSPTIAHDSRSIMAVYGATAVAAWFFHSVRVEYIPPPNWYVATTAGILTVSFALVWLTGQASERA